MTEMSFSRQSSLIFGIVKVSKVSFSTNQKAKFFMYIKTLYEAEVRVKSCEEEIFRKSIARKRKGQKTLDMMS